MMYMIAGHAKTGTSMVANILHRLGVVMGEDFGDWYHHKENLRWIDAINGPDAVDFVRAQDRAYRRWGVKHPSFADRIPEVITDARKAGVEFRIIVPFRDCWATRASVQREREKEISNRRRLKLLLVEAQKQCRLAESIHDLSPIHDERIFCFSYEKALVNPRSFFVDLMRFCQIRYGDDYGTDDIDEICQYISPGQGYLAIESWAERRADQSSGNNERLAD